MPCASSERKKKIDWTELYDVLSREPYQTSSTRLSFMSHTIKTIMNFHWKNCVIGPSHFPVDARGKKGELCIHPFLLDEIWV